MLEQFWFASGSSGGGGGDGGDPIGQSLRFRGAQYLQGPTLGSTNVYTISTWVKLQTLNSISKQQILFSPSTASSYFVIYDSDQATYPGIPKYWINNVTSWDGNISKRRYRDPSAWYHLIVQVSSAGTKVFFNGEQDPTVGSRVTINMAPFRVGANNTANANFRMHGYMADFHFIDGQALDPTTFGRFNSNGVWVPVTPGFADRSDALDVNYTSHLTTPSGNWNQYYAGSGAPPVQAFDGSTSTYASPLTATDSVTFIPADPLPIGRSLRVFMCHYADSSYTLNGSAVDTSGMSVGVCGWHVIPNPPATLTNFTMNANTTGNWIYAIEIDDVILIEGKGLYSWSRWLTTDDPVGFHPSYPPGNAFNGSTADYTQPNTATNKLTFTPEPPIKYNSSLRIFCCKYADQTMTVNGNSVTPAVGDATCNWNVDIQGSGTLAEFELGNSAVGGAYLYAIEVDGVILTNGSNPDYGVNGFHLTFADPNDIGKDYSGNANNFTATGFDTASYVNGYWVDAVNAATSGEIPNSQGAVYITDVQPANADLDYSSGNIQNVFDGDLSTSVYWVGDEYSIGNVLSMTFDLRDYTDVESVEVLTASGAPSTDHSYTLELLDASKNTIAGTQVKTSIAAYGAPKWVSAPVSGTPRYFRLWTTPLAGSVYKRMYLHAIRINGQVLSQSATTAPTYDLMQDSPTQNFATWNPNIVSIYQSPNYSNANLATNDANGSGGAASLTTIQPPQSGSYYYETYWITKNAASSWANLGFLLFDKANSSLTTATSEAERFYIQPSVQTISNFGNTGQSTGWTFQGLNDVIGWAWDIDNNEVTITKNGADAVTVTFNTTDRIVPAIWSALSHATTGINCGQQPFRYTPPAGFEALQTANLPAATIANGRDHFQAITDTGANILTAAQTAFPNGLWWIKDRVNANQHQLVDSVRGGNSALNTPGLAVGNYVAPAGDSVAWCWNVDGAAAENTDGTLTAQVASNTAAGFSIITWDGTNVVGTVGHGLTQAPEFIINKNSGNATAGTFYCWHTGIPATQYIALNSSGGAATSANTWNNLPPDDSIINLGSAGNGNHGPGRVMYAWHSIPGYSAFGSYTGNGNADGPFVYTAGFKPAFVMTKRTDSASGWCIQDSTRDPFNPSDKDLRAELVDGEESGSLYYIDLLSNGFKLRTSWSQMNGSGGTYIYAAFAENPFQAPVTAR